MIDDLLTRLPWFHRRLFNVWPQRTQTLDGYDFSYRKLVRDWRWYHSQHGTRWLHEYHAKHRSWLEYLLCFIYANMTKEERFSKIKLAASRMLNEEQYYRTLERKLPPKTGNAIEDFYNGYPLYLCSNTNPSSSET